jgi:hypothetical protein
MFLPDNRSHSPKDTASHLRRPKSSASNLNMCIYIHMSNNTTSKVWAEFTLYPQPNSCYKLLCVVYNHAENWICQQNHIHRYHKCHALWHSVLFDQYHLTIKFSYTHWFMLIFSGGKRDEKLILPLNDSISTTLSVQQVSYHMPWTDILNFLCITVLCQP